MTLNSKHKTQIVNLIIQQLQIRLKQCEEAANNAHLAAVDDQSVAETQYDTLAIESAYLAEGQSKRLLAIQAEINDYEAIKHVLDTKNKITIASLIYVYQQTKNQEETAHWYFIGPSAGGNKLKVLSHNVTIVTLASPLGKVLKGKSVDDEFELIIGKNIQQGFIDKVL